MKIVIINSSARKNGATAKILKEIADNFSSRGNVDITNINLSDQKLDFCVGCCGCYKNGVCFIDDDAEMLSDLISNADGVVIGTPTYASSISGQLKTFVDRGHFVIEQLMKDKYTLGVVTYENADGGAVVKALKKLFVFSGAKRFEKIIVKLPFNSDPLLSPRVKAKIKNKSEKLYNAIAKRKSSNLINAITNFAVFNFGIKPFVLKKGDKYDGVKKHWKKRNINFT
ncbi:MAG: NAD(P)H-dependent oxidoreductase [Oscillospiraceae bacterium]|jgi:NAD(P)H-dependent FMN reductase|nr:NAD(P)H-dependent oxidoreductase [Oscillospiraceae bacterium]